MVKPEWGVKRLCQSCNIRFYDLNSDPIVCPSCGAEYDHAAAIKPKRGKAAATAKATAGAKVAPEAPEDDLVEVDLDEEGTAEVADNDDTSVLEIEEEEEATEAGKPSVALSDDSDAEDVDFVAEDPLLEDAEDDDDDDDIDDIDDLDDDLDVDDEE